MLGIVLAWRFAAHVDDQFVRICVGLIAVLFPVYAIFKPKGKADIITGNKPLGLAAGITAGFTSFIAHAGGPPFQAYAIPQGLEKQIYAGTAMMFFAVVNFAKLLPYAMLGQFDRANLSTSLILIPLAPIGVLFGVYLVKRIEQQVFFRFIYGLIFMVGIKLLWDGLL